MGIEFDENDESTIDPEYLERLRKFNNNFAQIKDRLNEVTLALNSLIDSLEKITDIQLTDLDISQAESEQSITDLEIEVEELKESITPSNE